MDYIIQVRNIESYDSTENSGTELENSQQVSTYVTRQLSGPNSGDDQENIIPSEIKYLGKTNTDDGNGSGDDSDANENKKENLWR